MKKINDYTIIRTKTMTSHEEVKNSTPGVSTLWWRYVIHRKWY